MGILDAPALSPAEYRAEEVTITLSAQSNSSPIAGGLNTSSYGLGYNSPRVRHCNGVYSAYAQSSVTYYQNIVNAGDSIPESSREFWFYGKEFAQQFRNPIASNSELWIWIDDVPLTAGPVKYTAADQAGRSYWLTVTFPTSKIRKVRIWCGGNDLGALSFISGYHATPTTLDKQKFMTYGDSWVGGAGGVAGHDLWPVLLANGLGMESYRAGQGSTGLTTAGTGAPKAAYTDATRLARIATVAPDYLFIHLSQNDAGSDTSTVAAATTTVLDAVASGSPATQIIVGGMPRITSAPSAGYLALKDAGRDAALGHDSVIGFIDNIDDATYGAGGAVLRAATHNAWLTGTGAAGDPYVGFAGSADTSHLSAQGHRYWAGKLLPEVRRIIAAA